MASTIASLPIPDEDQCHLVWRAPAWLDQHSGHVTPLTALSYFCLSPFFDRRSTNQTLRMQTMYSGTGRGEMDPKEEAEALRRFVGVEYALVEDANGQALAEAATGAAVGSRENVFVIVKRERRGPDEVYPIATYLIIRGSIYQSPTLHSVLSVRLRTSLLAMQEMLKLAQSVRPPFSTRNGYNWRIKAEPGKAGAKKEGFEVPEIVDGGVKEDAMDVDRPAASSTKPTTKTTAPSDAFNPLLSRALQSTWDQLHAPPPPPPVPTAGPTHARTSSRTPSVAPATPTPAQQAAVPPSQSASQAGTPRPQTADAGQQGTASQAQVQAKAGDPSKYRVGPTGKRKPQRAA